MSRYLSYLLLLGLGLLLYLPGIGSYPLQDDVEGLNASASRYIARTGDWATPRVNTVRRLQKPPLMYWATAALYKLFGEKDYVPRLSVALAMLLSGLVTMAIGERILGQPRGFLSGLIFLTFSGSYLFTRTLMADAFLVLFTNLALLGLVLTFQHKNKSWPPLIFWGGVALSLLAKGIIGFAIPTLTLLWWRILKKDITLFHRLKPAIGFPLFLLLAGPWHLLASLQNPGWLEYYIVNEHLLRFLGDHYPKDFVSTPRPLFLLLHLIWWLPWTPLLLGFHPRSLKTSSIQTSSADLSLLLLLWIASWFLFFTVSARLEYYTFPSYPALAILLSEILLRSFDPSSPKPQNAWILRGWIVLGVIILGVGFSLFLSIPSQPQQKSPLIKDITRVTVFGPMDTLSLKGLSPLRFSLLGASLSLGLGTLLMAWMGKRRNWKGLMLISFLMMGCFDQIVVKSIAPFSSYLSMKPLAERLRQDFGKQAVVVFNGDFWIASSLGYYLDQPVYLVNGHPEYEFGSRFLEDRKIWLSKDQFLRLWYSPQPVVLVTEDSQLPQVLPMIQKGKYFYAFQGIRRAYVNPAGERWRLREKE